MKKKNNEMINIACEVTEATLNSLESDFSLVFEF